MTIDRTILTFQTGNSIIYHFLLNPLMTKDSIIEELIDLKNKMTNEFNISHFVFTVFLIFYLKLFDEEKHLILKVLF